MKLHFVLGLCLALSAPLLAHAEAVDVNGFSPLAGSRVSTTTSTTSQPVALGSLGVNNTVVFHNSGTNDVYARFGADNTVVATTSDYVIPAGGWVTLNARQNAYVALKAASGTPFVDFWVGKGADPKVSGVASSGGSGGASTIADGADVAQGATTDSPCAADNTSGCTIEARIQRIAQRITTLNNSIQGLLTTVGNVASGATDSGNPVKAGCVYHTSLPTVTDGQRVDRQCDANGRSILSPTGLNSNGQTTMANSAPVVLPSDQIVSVNPTGCTAYGLQSAASTNATSVVVGAKKFCGIYPLNTTTTVYFLRVYDLATAPTCSSATGFVRSWPIPPAPSAGLVGGFVITLSTAFTNGIAFCLTGGGSSTDNTNAATGVYVNLDYK